MKNSRKTHKIKEMVLNHLITNKREYLIILILFIIGIFSGVLFINNVKEEQFTNISNYINKFIEKIKSIEDINNMQLLKASLWQNIGVALLICFFGTTVIGIPVVFGLIIYRGFCLGYTISSCIAVLGTSKGLAFLLSNLLLQNIIFVPTIIAIAVSGFKLYKSIIKDKRKENIKLEIIRHIVFCGIMAILLVIASLVEVFISNNMLKMVVNYF
ncbi:MAG: stage II sporulation protein M [Clostridia bacterium]|nr:stage II sporulation protein M [Clostridia bacterium]